MSRMTFLIDAEEKAINQLVKVMEKQIDVVEVRILDPGRLIKKDLKPVKKRYLDSVVQMGREGLTETLTERKMKKK